ncbi:chloride channel protein [[Clostridium] fimetarium]|uniref:H+/Cl-antiporter ClcA n=1 Tax=[Clostridium] fimetarium TaxID=99656 RepID=A0A1I0RKY5_9FIRM|nr:chloride channel protein [[Clostridium] fimetarium]SEW41749.1 H+/Cl-antiporter ClcA [[Clostridium] fimetarium]
MIHRIYINYKEIIMYTLIAVLIGIIVGAIDAVFGATLLAITDIRDNNVMKIVPFLPIAGVAIMLLYKRFSKESIKGMTLVFQTGLGDNDRIPKSLIPLVMISTWITHLFGGSAGREGVAVQLGATVAHTIGRKMKMPNNSRVLLIAGMAAGFSGLFQTPLAATFFAMEVLVAGSLQYDALLPALMASFVASYTSHFLGLEKFSVVVQDNLDFSPTMILKLIVVGIAFGITGGVFAHVLSVSKVFFAKIINDPMKRIFAMGCVLSLIFLALHLGRYCGLGTNLISASFSGREIYIYDWILKFLLTILTLSAGFQGGEITPLFAIGSSLGIVLANLLGIPIEITAALGYAAVFGSGTNTLLAPILIGAEVFGPQNILYFAIVCSLAYVFNGNKTIYTAQKKFDYFSHYDGSM